MYITTYSYKGDSNEIVRNACSENRSALFQVSTARLPREFNELPPFRNAVYFPQISSNIFAYFRSLVLFLHQTARIARGQNSRSKQYYLFYLPITERKKKKRRRLCYARVRFGRCEYGPAKYTRCVSVAARGVASSLPAPFQLPGASFEVNVIRPLFRSLSRTRATVLTLPPCLPSFSLRYPL